MIWQRVRCILTAGLAALGFTGVAQADDGCCTPAPCFKTVCVTEYHQEAYQATRTCYKTEWKTETYTAYKTECKTEEYTVNKTECVAETRTRQVTCYKQVPEVQNLTRKVAICVPTEEERTVMQPFTTCVAVPTVCKKTVDKGHWECKCVECPPSCLEKFHSWCHRNDCCPPPCEVKYKTVKCWVPCPVVEETTVMTYKKVTECKPVTIKVCVNKIAWKEEPYTCTTYKCVPEVHTENYTVLVPHCVPVKCTRQVSVCVPYQATRQVSVCVPYTETYTAYKCVPVTVTKCVPVEVETCCKPKHHGLFSKKCCD
jgi:hypothetical protein